MSVNININVNITVNITVNMAPIEEKIDRAKLEAQAAMGEAFYNTVMANFGSVGYDRPWPWQRLSPAYAKRVGRTFATLYVTGALKDTVKHDASNPDAAVVSMANTAQVPYAMAHHHGNPGNFGFTAVGFGELPARRVFPLDNYDEPTDKVKDTCTQAAKTAVRGALS